MIDTREYRSRATNRRLQLVAASLTLQAKTHLLCVFIWHRSLITKNGNQSFEIADKVPVILQFHTSIQA